MLVSKGRRERLFLPSDRNSLRMAQGTNGMVWRAGPTTWAKCWWKWERKCRLRTKSVFLLKLHILQHLWGDRHDAEETRTHHFLSDNQPQYLRSTSLLWAPHHTYFTFKTTSCVCKDTGQQRVSRESATSCTHKVAVGTLTPQQQQRWPRPASALCHNSVLRQGWRSETHNSNGMTRSFLRRYALYHMFERRGWQEMRGEQIRNDKKQRDTNRGCSGSSGNTLVSKCVKEIINEDVFSWLIMLQQGKKSTLTSRRGCPCLIDSWFFYFKSSLALHNNKLCRLSTHELRNNEHWFTELNCIETFECWQSGVCFELEFNLCLYRPAQVRQMEN